MREGERVKERVGGGGGGTIKMISIMPAKYTGMKNIYINFYVEKNYIHFYRRRNIVLQKKKKQNKC